MRLCIIRHAGINNIDRVNGVVSVDDLRGLAAMIRILLAAALILTGCAPINLHPTEVMPTAVPTPKKLLDCDLIFPAPSPDTLKP
jgi:hypothetical protein